MGMINGFDVGSDVHLDLMVDDEGVIWVRDENDVNAKMEPLTLLEMEMRGNNELNELRRIDVMEVGGWTF